MTRIAWIAAAALLPMLACGPSEEGKPPTETATKAPAPSQAAQPAPAEAGADAVAEARTIFETRCVTCHGPKGAGDGPGSAALDPKPRNFQDAAWQSSVTDDHLEKIILYGGAAVGRSPAMPGNPDLQSKPAVTRALVEYLRNLSGS